jgi:hypothetical protein
MGNNLRCHLLVIFWKWHYKLKDPSITFLSISNLQYDICFNFRFFSSVINRETKVTTESETELSSTDKRKVLTGHEQENTTDTDDATELITDRRDDSIADG